MNFFNLGRSNNTDATKAEGENNAAVFAPSVEPLSAPSSEPFLENTNNLSNADSNSFIETPTAADDVPAIDALLNNEPEPSLDTFMNMDTPPVEETSSLQSFDSLQSPFQTPSPEATPSWEQAPALEPTFSQEAASSSELAMPSEPLQPVEPTFSTEEPLSPEPILSQPQPVFEPQPSVPLQSDTPQFASPEEPAQPQINTPQPVEIAIPTAEKAEPAAAVNVAAVNNAPAPSVAEGAELINDVNFSDVYVTPDKQCYVWSGRTSCGLKTITFADFNEFAELLEKAYDGENRSYLLNYKGRNYRVERTIALDGVQYCARKMPITVPEIRKLGFHEGVLKHLLSLGNSSGLILLAGATGSGKSTTVSALLKEFLENRGGYAYTIEDPIEMPLDGVYVTPGGELGLCKQTTPPDGKWEEGIKSALRSKPRYIYLGEIREPAVASEALRAATSGHLVLSTIHANNVNDAVNALVKYAASSGISEEMAYELVANGFLACVHQILEGAPKKAVISYLFANPKVSEPCQVRGMLRSGKLNLGTLLEQQRIKIDRNMPLF